MRHSRKARSATVGMKRAFVCSRSKLCHKSHMPRFRSRSTGVDLRRLWPIRTFPCHVPVLRSARLRTPTAFPFVASYSPSQSYRDTITMWLSGTVYLGRNLCVMYCQGFKSWLSTRLLIGFVSFDPRFSWLRIFVHPVPR